MSHLSRQSLHDRIRAGGTPSPSAEHYLRAVLMLTQNGEGARVTDLAEELGVTKATVTITARTLGKKGLVHRDSQHRLLLTTKGSRFARRVCARHAVLHGFLEEVLGMPRDLVEEDVCRIEHGVSDRTTERLLELVKFFRENGGRLPGKRRDFPPFPSESGGARRKLLDCTTACGNHDCIYHPEHKARDKKQHH